MNFVLDTTCMDVEGSDRRCRPNSERVREEFHNVCLLQKLVLLLSDSKNGSNSKRSVVFIGRNERDPLPLVGCRFSSLGGLKLDHPRSDLPPQSIPVSSSASFCIYMCLYLINSNPSPLCPPPRPPAHPLIALYMWSLTFTTSSNHLRFLLSSRASRLQLPVLSSWRWTRSREEKSNADRLVIVIRGEWSLPVGSLHVPAVFACSVPAWVSCGCSGFLPQSKVTSIGVNDCLSLCVSSVIVWVCLNSLWCSSYCAFLEFSCCSCSVYRFSYLNHWSQASSGKYSTWENCFPL